MSQRTDHPRTAESRDKQGTAPARRGQVLTDSPTTPRDNPPTDEGRVRLVREDYAKVLGN